MTNSPCYCHSVTAHVSGDLGQGRAGPLGRWLGDSWLGGQAGFGNSCRGRYTAGLPGAFRGLREEQWGTQISTPFPIPRDQDLERWQGGLSLVDPKGFVFH